MSLDRERVGLIGLGLVGLAAATRLVAAGRLVVGWDLAPTRREALSAMGGEAAGSLPDLSSACGTLLIAVYDAAQAEAVLNELPAGETRHTVVCITTCGREEAVRLSERCVASGRVFLEFPISGTSQQIRDGTSTGFLAGDRAAADRVAHILETVCPSYAYVGGTGHAACMKLAVNLVLQLNRAALAEGIALAESLGLDARQYLAILRSSAASSQVMETKGLKMVQSDYAPESRIAQTLKDATLILAAGRAAGQLLPLLEVQAALLCDVVAEHGGDLDSSAVIEALRSRRRPTATRETT